MMEMRSEAKIQRVEMKSDMNTIRFHLEALNKHQDKWDKTAETMLHKLNNALNVDIQKTVKYLIDEHKNQK